jgi:hypothetical protein
MALPGENDKSTLAGKKEFREMARNSFSEIQFGQMENESLGFKP